MRLDLWLCEEHDLEIQVARSYILQGLVSVNGEKILQAGRTFRPDRDNLEFRRPPDFRNRGTAKLRPALEYIKSTLKKDEEPPWVYWPCLDIGASHGGFTAALLEASARRIYSLDVAYGIFDYQLRKREDVILLERKNVRHLEPSWFDDLFLSASGIFIVCDVSFLSLRPVLESVIDFFRLHMQCGFQGLFLLKHQFEASHQTQQGVLRDDELRRKLEDDIEIFLKERGLNLLGSIPAGLPGRKGNRETFLWLEFPKPAQSAGT